jgi:hypothetical protein
MHKTGNGNYLSFELVSATHVLMNGPYHVFTEHIKKLIKSFGGSWKNEAECKGWLITKDVYNELLKKVFYHIYDKLKEQVKEVELRGVPWFGFAVLRKLEREMVYFDCEKKQ